MSEYAYRKALEKIPEIVGILKARSRDEDYMIEEVVDEYSSEGSLLGKSQFFIIEEYLLNHIRQAKQKGFAITVNDDRVLIRVERASGYYLATYRPVSLYRSKTSQIAEAYQSGQLSSLDLLDRLLCIAAKADNPTLSSLHDELKETLHVPVPVSRFIEDVESLASDMQKRNTTTTSEIDVRRRLREIIWVKHRIKDNDFYETAYRYISRFYTDAASKEDLKNGQAQKRIQDKQGRR